MSKTKIEFLSDNFLTLLTKEYLETIDNVLDSHDCNPMTMYVNRNTCHWGAVMATHSDDHYDFYK